MEGHEMKRIVLLLSMFLALASATSASALGELPETQVTLSCSDDHSAIVYLDSAALTELTSEVAAINSGDAGTSCMLAEDSSSTSSGSDPVKWTVYDYNPSDQAIRPRNSPGSMPATTEGNTTSFPFIAGIYTALLTTRDKALTGDQSTTTLDDLITVTGDPSVFQSQHGDGCNVPPNVRFYFTAPSASGSSVGSPPAGFYTAFWWSNPMNLPLLVGNQAPGEITAHLSNPAEWSDWNGQSGANPAVTPAFLKAIQKIQTIGLSFGGGCFFENGVTITDGQVTFSSTFSEAQ
jgi:hypothetical protein